MTGLAVRESMTVAGRAESGYGSPARLFSLSAQARQDYLIRQLQQLNPRLRRHHHPPGGRLMTQA